MSSEAFLKFKTDVNDVLKDLNFYSINYSILLYALSFDFKLNDLYASTVEPGNLDPEVCKRVREKYKSLDVKRDNLNDVIRCAFMFNDTLYITKYNDFSLRDYLEGPGNLQFGKKVEKDENVSYEVV